MQEFENIFIFRLTPLEAIINLAVALLCGLLISMFYRFTYRGVSYSSSYVIAIIMLAMITALVIMVIGNNLARAFGLVGAMSIIRFRTAIKDTQDIMFIFFSLAAGLACGAGMYLIALFGTFFIGISLMVISTVFSENPARREYLLQIVISENVSFEKAFNDILDRFCSKNKLINVKSLKAGEEEILELSYYVILKRERFSRLLVSEIQSQEGVRKVNLFYDEE